jgi:hypothetical protein
MPPQEISDNKKRTSEKSPPNKPKSKVRREHEEMYIDRIRDLKINSPEEFAQAEEWVTKQGMSDEDAWGQIEENREASLVAVPPASHEQGECPGCLKQYCKLDARPKMRSDMCGHALCGDCIETFHAIMPGKCQQTGCPHRLRSSDFTAWEPTPPPSNYPLGKLNNVIVPRVSRRPAPAMRQDGDETDVVNSDDKGLFVTDDEGSGENDVEIKSEEDRNCKSFLPWSTGDIANFSQRFLRSRQRRSEMTVYDLASIQGC